MIRISRQLGWWLTALAALLAVCALQFVGLLRPLENFATDLRARALKHERRSDIVIVGIDAASIQAALQALLGDPARRTALGDAGYSRAMEFSWAASAEAHMISYERAAAQAAE